MVTENHAILRTVILREKDLGWLHFEELPRAKEMYYIPVLHIQAATISTIPDMITVLHARLYGRFIEIQSNISRNKFPRKNQASHFVEGTLSDIDSERAPIQLRRESQTHRN